MESYSTVVTNTTEEPLHERNSPEAISEAVTLIVIMIASFFANILAMTMILSSTKLKKNHHNLLIINLNVIDLGIILFSMTFSVAAIFDDGALLTNYPIVCTLNGFCAITCSLGNFTNVMCIAVDRYIAIVWSTRFPPTRRRVYFLIAFVWVVSITITLPPTFELLSAFEYTEDTHHCSPRWDVCSYYLIWFTVIFGVTVPVMIFCYACIIYHIRKSDRKLQFYDGIKAGSKICKQLSESKVSNSSLQNSPNLGTNAFTDRYCNDRRCLQQLPMNETQNDVHVGYQNGGVDAQTNYAFQADELDLHDIEILDSSLESMGPGPFVISGKIDGQSALQSSTTFGQSKETNSFPSANVDAAMSRKRKLSTDKRVALTGALLILTTIFCWAPYCIIHFCNFPAVGHPVAAATMWMAYANALLDPLVYVFMNRKDSTVQHLSRILRTFWSVPVKTWRRLCAEDTDDYTP